MMRALLLGLALVAAQAHAQFSPAFPAFVQSGAGAVARPWIEKARDAVDVRDFGAKCDGTTDDTSAIQAAVTAAYEVRLPQNKTCLVRSVTLDAGTIISGAGAGSVLKQSTGGTVNEKKQGILFADSGAAGSFVTGVTLRDFKVLGNVATLGFDEQVHLIGLNGVKNAVIERVYFEGNQGDALYLGSGISGVDERHNVDVVVRDSFFDGVNNDNRNCISVIDGDGVLIEGSTFKNCARSTMPGSVDFEPDQSFGVIKNIRIIGNRFLNTDGNRGHVAIQTQNTTNVENIVIKGNHFEDVPVGSAGVLLNLSTSAPAAPHRIVIEGNTFDLSGSRGIYKRDGALDGLVIKGNIISALTGVWLSFAGAETTSANISIEGNIIYDEATSSGVLVNETFSNLAIRGNVFKGTPARHIQFGGTAYSAVSITNNDFIGAASAAVIASSTTTPNAVTNVLLGNRFENNALVQFAAARSDYPGNIGNPTGADEASAPNVWNPGVSRVRLQSRSIAGATQDGILETYALIGTGYTTHLQFFYPDDSASFKDKVYFRKATNGTTWDSWYLLSGQLSGTATLDPASLAAGATQQSTVTVTGAAAGDFCTAAHTQVNAGIVWLCSVTAANTATVTQWNRSAGAIDLASGTLTVRATKP